MSSRQDLNLHPSTYQVAAPPIELRDEFILSSELGSNQRDMVLQTIASPLSHRNLRAKYQDRTGSPVWKTGALPLSYISHEDCLHSAAADSIALVNAQV